MFNWVLTGEILLPTGLEAGILLFSPGVVFFGTLTLVLEIFSGDSNEEDSFVIESSDRSKAVLAPKLSSRVSSWKSK